MTEKNKMINEELYDSTDSQLVNERNIAKDLCFTFNNTKPSGVQKQKEVLIKLLGKTPKEFVILSPFWCDYGYNIEIGDNFFANHNLVILDAAKVIFGNNVFIGPNCSFYTINHPLDYETRNKGLEYAKRITVGNNVWMGGNVVVLPGITIGDNSVIGAGSVVTKNIPSNSIVVGNPARVIKVLIDKL